GLFIGICVGFAAALLLDRLDDTIVGKEDAERVLRGVPIVGLIPTVPSWKDRSHPLLVSVEEPTSAAAEAYRALRTAVQFLGLDRPLQLVQFTSASAIEGKT